MKRYIVEWSNDNHTWEDAGRSFTSLAKAKEHFDELQALPSFEWRVGFLLKVRSGHVYRLLDSKKKGTVP